MSAVNDLDFYKGEDVVQPCHQVLEGTTTDEDITGWTIVLTIKPTPTYPTPLLTVPASITAPASGRYQVHLPHVKTAAIRAGSYYYDIQRTDAGSEAVLSIGRCIVSQEVLYP